MLKTRHSEGGSEFIHANLKPGMTLEVSGPLNHFVAVERASEVAAQAIDVTCRKSKKEFVVGANQSILEAMETNGIPILGSCRKGVCGTCEVRVVEGEPVHLDSVMPDDEKDSLRVMYPCVSRVTDDRLVLDI